MKSFRSSALFACAMAVILVPASFTLAAKGGRRKRTPPNSSSPASSAANSMAATLQQDQKEIAADQAALTKAGQALEVASAKARSDFESRPDVVAARKAVADASAREENLRQDLLSRLASDPGYKSAKADETRLRSELDDLRNSNASQDAISSKAAEVFQAGGITSKLEREAEGNDTRYAAAEKTLTEANATLSALRTRFQASLKNDPSFAPLVQAREEAQKKLTADQAKLAADRRGGSPHTASVGSE